MTKQTKEITMTRKALDEMLDAYIRRYAVDGDELFAILAKFTGLGERAAYLEVIAVRGEAEKFDRFLRDWFGGGVENGDR
jgi:hypothetical protein